MTVPVASVVGAAAMVSVPVAETPGSTSPLHPSGHPATGLTCAPTIGLAEPSVTVIASGASGTARTWSVRSVVKVRVEVIE